MKLKTYPYIQMDVFTTKPFAGNPLAIVPDAAGLSDIEMQKIAAEMNLSETVFVLPSLRALRALRIFTPSRELPFAGHPVVGTWNALALNDDIVPWSTRTGWVRIENELKIGVLPVDIEFKDGRPSTVMMTQGPFEILSEDICGFEKLKIAQNLGLHLEDLHPRLPLRTVSTGVPFLMVPVRGLGALGRCNVKSQPLAESYSKFSAIGCYVFATETKENDRHQAHARMFVNEPGIAEDPATGSAAGALGGYLVTHHALTVEAWDGLFSFVIEQGDFIDRPSRINVEVMANKDNSIKSVRVGGPSVLVARGEISF